MDVPVETRVFALSHGSVDDLLAKVQPLVSKDYGSIQTDKRSNTLVVTDNLTRLAEISAVVKAFDVRERAVLIEAKIVQVVLGDHYQFGINWERAFQYNRTGGNSYSGGAVFNTDSQLVPLQAYGGAPVTGASAGAAKLSGITASLTALTGIQVAGALNFLQTVGNTKILSSPRIVALNGQESKILVGTKQAYVTTTVLSPGGGATVTTTEQINFVDVGVKLFVTPVIGEDGFITLKVKPEVSSVDSTITTAEGNTVPIVRVSQAETSLVVKDGVTVIIGGLIEDSKVDTKSGIPILSQIPILGIPFRSQDTNNQKTELVIFLTPKIVDGEASSPEAQDYLPKKDWPPDLPKKKPGFWQRLFGSKDA
jgi:type II secretory pathway component GspD/PulD (secretin)